MKNKKKVPDLDWKNLEKDEKVSLILRILVWLIAIGFFIVLIFGKSMFGANDPFYQSINIFNESIVVPNKILRSISYLVIVLSIAKIIRIVVKFLFKYVHRGKAIGDLLSSFIKYIAVIVVLFAILKTWGVDTAALIAGVGILSLVVGLGAQPLIEDIIAGLFIVFEEIFDVGDIIVVDGFRGTVKEIGIRTTQIEDAGGDVKVVNNSDIRTLINMTSQLSLAITEVDIEYNESLERVELVIKDNLEKMKKNIPDIVNGPYYMGVSRLAASGVTLRFTAQCPESKKYQVERDLNRQIKLIFDKNNISIPYNQIVVHQAIEESNNIKIDSAAAQKFVEDQKELSKDLIDDDGDNNN